MSSDWSRVDREDIACCCVETRQHAMTVHGIDYGNIAFTVHWLLHDGRTLDIGVRSVEHVAELVRYMKCDPVEVLAADDDPADAAVGVRLRHALSGIVVH